MRKNAAAERYWSLSDSEQSFQFFCSPFGVYETPRMTMGYFSWKRGRCWPFGVLSVL